MWATSIGSTFAQIPVSGVRKSGIPEGTETPAPVSATVQPDSPISSASRAASAVRLYLPLHFGVRLPRKAEMPSLASSLREGGGEALLLGLDPRVEVALCGRRA